MEYEKHSPEERQFNTDHLENTFASTVESLRDEIPRCSSLYKLGPAGLHCPDEDGCLPLECPC